jgi:processive 1,2-diacylglycerol beta-glucosyltransferase
VSFGSGHGRAADAVAAALQQRASVDVQVVDVLADCRFPFRALYVWPYWAMVRYAPSLWKRLFDARLRRMHRHTAPAWAFRRGCAPAFEMISRVQPDVIVAVEVAACEVAVISRRDGLTRASVLNVITDCHAEPAWVQPEVSAYAVADRGVLEQLREWGAPEERISISGIPIDPAFGAVRIDARRALPVVLLMGGGMGPTRMDRVAACLVASSVPMHIVAVTGRDVRALRRMSRINVDASPISMTVRGWTNDVPDLMRDADVLVTKPGGLTTAEGAACGLPMVLFDAIPGPEQHNAARAVAAGAAVATRGADETASTVVALLREPLRREALSAAALRLARRDAADAVADLALRLRSNEQPPVLILTISNGAGHTSVAHAIASELREVDPAASPLVVDVADYMNRLTKLTHVTLYLWLVTHAPALWGRIDRYQKSQRRTSPDWYYRRGCRALFALASRLRPRAIVATEVGCAEIAALIKRDLALDCPLIAVNGEYDADRAWIQPEIDVYCAATSQVGDELRAHGAITERLRVLGVPLAREFHIRNSPSRERADVCTRLNLDADEPVVLVSGGSEGLGGIDAVVSRLLRVPRCRLNIVVLVGRNTRLKTACERIAGRQGRHRVRVLGWTSDVAELMRAADVMVSKLGHTFDEALASGLPVVALEPPPGSERVQYHLLDSWGVGRAVRSLDEMAAVVERLLRNPSELAEMRRAALGRHTPGAAQHIAALLLREGARA